MIEQAKQIALAAGEILLEHRRLGFSVHKKGAIDLVTDADRAADKYIVGELTRFFPEHSILAEESGWTKGAAEFVWLIDPLDGTTNYAHGFPHFCVSLGLATEQQVILGVVYDPLMDECFTAELGGGACLNGEKISVSTISALKDSLLATGFPYDFEADSGQNMHSFGKATGACQGVRCTGSAALDFCYVACGRLEAFWERRLAPWDSAAGSLIVAEAGGKVTDCAGQPFDHLGAPALASNGLIHDQLLAVLLG